jgi:hypothetical protein
MVRFEGEEIVRRQAIHAIGQAFGKPPLAAAHDDTIEELLLSGQVALDLDGERRVGEKSVRSKPKRRCPSRSVSRS